MECSECKTPMVETEPMDSDIWFGEPEGATVFVCPSCESLEAA